MRNMTEEDQQAFIEVLKKQGKPIRASLYTRYKTIVVEVDSGAFGGLSKGDTLDDGWIVIEIVSVGMDEYGVTITCDCKKEMKPPCE